MIYLLGLGDRAATIRLAASPQVKEQGHMVHENGLALIFPSQFFVLGQQAAECPRQRLVHCFHQGDHDNPHRFLNVIARGSYVAPHRHAEPPKAESFVMLHGELGVLLFAQDGSITSAHRLRAAPADLNPTANTPACGLDLLPGCWHTIVALTPITVIFEVKPGPYDAATDKEFAPWAPTEGSADAPSYLRLLEEQFGLP